MFCVGDGQGLVDGETVVLVGDMGDMGGRSQLLLLVQSKPSYICLLLLLQQLLLLLYFRHELFDGLVAETVPLGQFMMFLLEGHDLFVFLQKQTDRVVFLP